MQRIQAANPFAGAQVPVSNADFFRSAAFIPDRPISRGSRVRYSVAFLRDPSDRFLDIFIDETGRIGSHCRA